MSPIYVSSVISTKPHFLPARTHTVTKMLISWAFMSMSATVRDVLYRHIAFIYFTDKSAFIAVLQAPKKESYRVGGLFFCPTAV